MLNIFLNIGVQQTKKTYIDIFFDAYWQDGLNLNEEKIIISLLKKCKINKDYFLKKIKDQKMI